MQKKFQRFFSLLLVLCMALTLLPAAVWAEEGGAAVSQGSENGLPTDQPGGGPVDEPGKTGKFSVVCRAYDIDGYSEDTFTFTFQFTDGKTATYGGITFTDGAYTFSLKHGESITFTDIPYDAEFLIQEHMEIVPDGYYSLMSQWYPTGVVFTMGDDDVDGATITYTYRRQAIQVLTPLTVDIPVSKVWNDLSPDERPSSVEVSLLDGDAVVQTVTLTAEDGWKGVFAGVPAYRQDEQLCSYTIREENPGAYAVTYTQPVLELDGLKASENAIHIQQNGWKEYDISGANLFISTGEKPFGASGGMNTPEVTLYIWTAQRLSEEEIRAIKKELYEQWRSQFDPEEYPELPTEEEYFQVYALTFFSGENQITFATGGTLAVRNEKAIFSNPSKCPQFIFGNLAVRVKQEAVIANEDAAVLHIRKVWNDKIDSRYDRGDVTVVVYADGVKHSEHKLTCDGGYQLGLNLPKYKAGTDTEIRYTVEELPFDGYTSELTMQEDGGALYIEIVNTPAFEFTVPIEKIVRQGGATAPGKKTFRFELTDLPYSLKDGDIQIAAGTDRIVTNGAGTYQSELVFRVTDPEVYLALLNNGFSIREVNDHTADWSCDSTVWHVTFDRGSALSLETDGGGWQPDKVSIPILFVKDGDNNTYSLASFTNTYTHSSRRIDDSYTPRVPPKGDKLPETGRLTLAAPALAAAAILGAAAFLLRRKK